MTVAAAEAAEKHYARAKDASKLQLAIRAKLEAQAEFVLWWDTQANRQHEWRPKNSDRSGRVLKPESVGLDARTISRWRKKLNDPVLFERTYESALARYVKLLEMEGAGAHVGQNSGDATADKKHAILLALQAWPDRSGREIAAQVGCDRRYVDRLRQEGIGPHVSDTRVTGKDGKSYPASRASHTIDVIVDRFARGAWRRLMGCKPVCIQAVRTQCGEKSLANIASPNPALVLFPFVQVRGFPVRVGASAEYRPAASSLRVA